MTLAEQHKTGDLGKGGLFIVMRYFLKLHEHVLIKAGADENL